MSNFDPSRLSVQSSQVVVGATETKEKGGWAGRQSLVDDAFKGEKAHNESWSMKQDRLTTNKTSSFPRTFGCVWPFALRSSRLFHRLLCSAVPAEPLGPRPSISWAVPQCNKASGISRETFPHPFHVTHTGLRPLASAIMKLEYRPDAIRRMTSGMLPQFHDLSTIDEKSASDVESTGK